MAKHILIGGGSGFIGSALTNALRARGDRVTILSRYPGAERVTWDDLAGGIPDCDAVVNLAGEHILQPGRRWNAAYRDEVISSRTDTTKTLVDAINNSAKPPAVFVSTAGKCFYGTQMGATDYPELDEDSDPMGVDFPAELVGQWEKAADHLSSDVVMSAFELVLCWAKWNVAVCWVAFGALGGHEACYRLYVFHFVLGWVRDLAKARSRFRGYISMTWWAC